MEDDYEKDKKKKRKVNDDKEDKLPKDFKVESFEEFFKYLADNLKNMLPDLEDMFSQIKDRLENGELDLEDLNDLNNFQLPNTYIPQKSNPATIAKTSPKDPIIDVMDCGNEILIIAELPGLDKDDIKLNLKSNSVLISVHKKKIHKRVPLSCNVDKDKMIASYNNGILEIKLVKA